MRELRSARSPSRARDAARDSARSRARRYPEIRLAILPGAATSRAWSTSSSPTPCTSRPKRRSASPCARHCLATGRAVHDRVPHAVSRVRPRPLSAAGRGHLPLAALVPRARVRGDGADAARFIAGSSRGDSRTSPYWSRGVDTELFEPAPREALPRTAADLPLRGPRRRREEPRGVPAPRPAGHEVGRRRRTGARRARGRVPGGHVPRREGRAGISRYYYQQADVFVFPSRTDTFGLVMIEAMACGTPVAAYPGHRADRRRARSGSGRAGGGPARRRDGRASPRSRRRAPLRAPVFVDRGDAAVHREPVSCAPAHGAIAGGLTAAAATAAPRVSGDRARDGRACAGSRTARGSRGSGRRRAAARTHPRRCPSLRRYEREVSRASVSIAFRLTASWSSSA